MTKWKKNWNDDSIKEDDFNNIYISNERDLQKYVY